MTIHRNVYCALIIATAATTSGCATSTAAALDSGSESQLQKRSYQTRYFESGDKEGVLRGVISTLQDLGFVIEQSNLLTGSVSGTRYHQGQVYKATGSVRDAGPGRQSVRMNFQYGVKPVSEPVHYQNFFAALGKSLFLQANAE